MRLIFLAAEPRRYECIGHMQTRARHSPPPVLGILGCASCLQSKGGEANESVLVDDLKGFVQRAVKLVHGVAAAIKEKEARGGAPKARTGEDAPTAYSHR